ncbi:hypothetical protein VHUM_02274 [Vanrija humicola]|uniref:Ribosomal RNA-processing protein 14/surfeit locus protein 6 C-terminal domain-containing protein n=1 Tax=Vanrija humicola TaxID=5417 RepID=A0A7D8V191_VANHU|nr:hypothetical protein VHUM_02274 [Vanrija humicola]
MAALAPAAAVPEPSGSTQHDPALLASLEARNAVFASLLSLIPQQYYLGPSEEQLDSRWMKKKKRKTGDEIKEHKKKAKQDKLDPANLGASGADAPAPASSNVPDIPPALMPPAASIGDLRDRMKTRLDAFKRQRGVDDDDEDPQSRGALEAARREKRGEMRDKRRKERKEERKKARLEPTAKTAKTQLLVPQLPRETDSVTFPSVALPSAGKSRAPLKKLSNAGQALAHLEKHQNKLASLPEDKRREAEERDRWAKAEERAAGGKVADDEKVLKKAVKREEKRKAKGGKEWVERKRTLEKAQAASIKKRNDNIAARADGKRNKRLGIKDKGDKKAGGKSKKGRPGFEGKSKDKKAAVKKRA